MNPIFLVCHAFAHVIHGFVVVDKLTVTFFFGLIAGVYYVRERKLLACAFFIHELVARADADLNGAKNIRWRAEVNQPIVSRLCEQVFEAQRQAPLLVGR
jgi:hypothetical protein